MFKTVSNTLRWNRVIAFLAIIALISTVFTITASAEEYNVTTFGKVTTNLRIREQPTTESTQVGLLYKDQVIEIYGKVDNWYRVEGGFVSADYVSLMDNSIAELANVDNFYTVDDLNIYNMSNLRNNYIGTIAKKVKCNSVTGGKSLNFVGEIPIYDIIDEYAYFGSGQNIYKTKITNFDHIEAIGYGQHIVDAYRTVYYNSSNNRKYNIGLVASKIDGIVIKAGYKFSYNKSTGPRGENEGYKLATVIFEGEYTEDFGGGICQVSSTIYAAIKNDSNFHIISRHAHALPVSYLPEGMDATVSYGGTDFKFRNDYLFDVILNVSAKDGVLLVKIIKKE